MGLMFTYMHINAGAYDRYNPQDLEDGRKHPERYRTKASIEEALEQINDNEFAVTHHIYSQKLEQQLYNFKKIILHRNPKDAADSWNRWNKESGRNRPRKVTIPDSIKKWSDKRWTFTLSFEDMINKNTKVIDDLQQFLFAEIKYNSLDILELSLSQDSLTKSSLRNVN